VALHASGHAGTTVPETAHAPLNHENLALQHPGEFRRNSETDSCYTELCLTCDKLIFIRPIENQEQSHVNYWRFFMPRRGYGVSVLLVQQSNSSFVQSVCWSLYLSFRW